MIFERRRYHKDNYLYLLAEGDDAALIDPGDAEVASRVAEEHCVRPRFILHTHGHADHTGGSARLRNELKAQVLGHSGDAPLFAPDREIDGQEELVLGALRISVVQTPGHTPGSVLFIWRGRVFSGDTLFWCGAGNCRHGGDPAMLAESLLGPIARLDGSLLLHPGHDYAAQNAPFALSLEPENLEIRKRNDAVVAARARGLEPEAPTLNAERSVNPFLRVDVPTVREAIEGHSPGAGSPKARVVALRGIRDEW